MMPTGVVSAKLARLAASPDDRLGHDLAAVQNGVGQLPVDLADGGDRAELVEPG
jgi:hypothetical protein